MEGNVTQNVSQVHTLKLVKINYSYMFIVNVDVVDIIIIIPSSSPEQISRGRNQGSKRPAQQFPDRDLLHIRDIPRPPVPLHAGQEPEEQLQQRIHLP